MAGDRGRDLTFSILSDTQKLQLERPAQQLGELGEAAVSAGRDLDQLDGQAAARGLDDVGRRAVDTARDLEKLERSTDELGRGSRDAVQDLSRMERATDELGPAARDTARKVETAFDAIARESKSAAKKLDSSTDDIERSLDGVKDEASGTAREMAASFDGSADSVIGAFQELTAQAGESFGPIGVAVGVAAGVGIGMIQAEAEKIKQTAADMIEEMVEANGRLTAAAIDAKVLQMATDDPDAFAREKRMIDDLGVSWRDYARAKAGDAEAAARITQALADVNAKITEQAAAAGSASGEMYTQQAALTELSGNLGTTAEAYALAKQATEGYTEATSTVGPSTERQTAAAGRAWDNLSGVMSDPIRAKVALQTPSRAAYVAVRQDMTRGLGTIVIPVKPGQSRFANTAANSRYRD